MAKFLSRAELKTLGIEDKEIIDKILSAYHDATDDLVPSSEVEAAKKEALRGVAETEPYKRLQKELDEAKASLEAKDQESAKVQKEYEDYKKEAELKDVFTQKGAKAKYIKDLMAKLAADKDPSEQLDTLKEEYPELFEGKEEPKKPAGSPDGGQQPTGKQGEPSLSEVWGYGKKKE